MRKTTFQRVTTNRILEAAPDLKYVAFYRREEDRLNACMRNYADRSFVYVMTAMHEGKEYYLYAGKSKAQYARHLMHSKKLAYDHIYLFESEPEHLAENETAVIRELAPLFNRKSNPRAEQYKRLFAIDYDSEMDRNMISHYLEKYSRYEKKGLFGFAFPVPFFTALEKMAAAENCNCSEWLQRMLEKELGQRIEEELSFASDLKTNLTTTKEFGKQHQRSQEQAKQYFHQKNRVPGAVKVGRDWVLPRDTRFPVDLRGKRKKAKENMEKAV